MLLKQEPDLSGLFKRRETHRESCPSLSVLFLVTLNFSLSSFHTSASFPWPARLLHPPLSRRAFLFDVGIPPYKAVERVRSWVTQVTFHLSNTLHYIRLDSLFPSCAAENITSPRRRSQTVCVDDPGLFGSGCQTSTPKQNLKTTIQI